jgi:uncharacterized membrane protein YphA (DoxX/SURF4 family)
VRVDPAVSSLLALGLGAIFIAGAAPKLKARDLFVDIVQAYGLLPIPLVAVAAFMIAVMELIVGIGLIIPITRELAAPLGLLLLALVTAAVIVNLLRGNSELSCGCGGASADQHLSWTLVGRNLLLACLLGMLLLPIEVRTWSVLDYGTAIIGAAMTFGLYAAFNQLLANAPRIASLEF